MTVNRNLSKFQALFGHHDDCLMSASGVRLRVDTLTGCTPMQHGPMQRYVAEAIDDAERAFHDHTDHRAAQWRHRSGSTSTTATNGSGTNSDTETDDSAASQALDDLLGGTEDDVNLASPDDDTRTDGGTTATAQTSNRKWVVPPSRIELLELTEDTTVRSSVFPRTVRCDSNHCDHYEFIDPKNSGNLNCPDGCGGTLRQYPMVFVCPRCANVDPLQPQGTRLDDDHIGTLPCEACDNGHYHLFHRSSMATASFRCSSCGDTRKITRYCPECHIPSDDDGNGGVPSVMKPTPADASSIVSPMVKSALYLQDREISLAALEDAHEEIHDPYKWGADMLDTGDRDVLLDFWGLHDLYTVRDVTSLTAVYGYQTRVNAQGTDLSDGERLTRTFDHRENMKRAYVARTSGRGLVFDLDTERLYTTAAEIADSLDADDYDDLADRELTQLNELPVKQLVDDEHRLVLVPLLHALEHALYQAASQEIGMDDVLGSKLLIEDGAIVLFERENVGSGGLAQLTLDEQARVLKKFLRNAAEQLAQCGQFCSEGCPSCVFVDDFHCRPYLPTEVSRWVPPNALLNRDIADEFIHAH